MGYPSAILSGIGLFFQDFSRYAPHSFEAMITVKIKTINEKLVYAVAVGVTIFLLLWSSQFPGWGKPV